MMTRITFIVLIAIAGCREKRKSIEGDQLPKSEYEALMGKLLPYLVKKPDHFGYDERFNPSNAAFYQNFATMSGARLRYYYPTDTANFFFFEHQDLTSLHQHYRGLGGYFRLDANGSITFLNLLYHTPRFTGDEMAAKGEVLFKEMIAQGNVNRFMGRRDFIHVPNNDFYYDTKRNRWDHTENSSWKFLDEEQRRSDSTNVRSDEGADDEIEVLN